MGKGYLLLAPVSIFGIPGLVVDQLPSTSAASSRLCHHRHWVRLLRHLRRRAGLSHPIQPGKSNLLAINTILTRNLRSLALCTPEKSA
jgi:hypothetical protein